MANTVSAFRITPQLNGLMEDLLELPAFKDLPRPQALFFIDLIANFNDSIGETITDRPIIDLLATVILACDEFITDVKDRDAARKIVPDFPQRPIARTPVGADASTFITRIQVAAASRVQDPLAARFQKFKQQMWEHAWTLIYDSGNSAAALKLLKEEIETLEDYRNHPKKISDKPEEIIPLLDKWLYFRNRHFHFLHRIEEEIAEADAISMQLPELSTEIFQYSPAAYDRWQESALKISHLSNKSATSLEKASYYPKSATSLEKVSYYPLRSAELRKKAAGFEQKAKIWARQARLEEGLVAPALPDAPAEAGNELKPRKPSEPSRSEQLNSDIFTPFFEQLFGTSQWEGESSPQKGEFSIIDASQMVKWKVLLPKDGALTIFGSKHYSTMNADLLPDDIDRFKGSVGQKLHQRIVQLDPGLPLLKGYKQLTAFLGNEQRIYIRASENQLFRLKEQGRYQHDDSSTPDINLEEYDDPLTAQASVQTNSGKKGGYVAQDFTNGSRPGPQLMLGSYRFSPYAFPVRDNLARRLPETTGVSLPSRWHSRSKRMSRVPPPARRRGASAYRSPRARSARMRASAYGFRRSRACLRR